MDEAGAWTGVEPVCGLCAEAGYAACTASLRFPVEMGRGKERDDRRRRQEARSSTKLSLKQREAKESNDELRERQQVCLWASCELLQNRARNPRSPRAEAQPKLNLEELKQSLRRS